LLELLLDPLGRDPRTVVKMPDSPSSLARKHISWRSCSTYDACSERVEAKGCKEVANAFQVVSGTGRNDTGDVGIGAAFQKRGRYAVRASAARSSGTARITK